LGAIRVPILTRIRSNGKHLLLIDNVLDIAKIESGHVEHGRIRH
jgi:hypothetical protein